MSYKKQILNAAQKMRKVLKEQRKNKIHEAGVVKYYTDKYQQAYRELLDLLLD